MWWWEVGENHIREERGQVQPAAGPILCAGREVSPRAEVQTTEGAKEFRVIQSGEAQGQRSEEWVSRRSQCGEESERRVWAEGAQAATPDRGEGERSDEVPLVRAGI